MLVESSFLHTGGAHDAVGRLEVRKIHLVHAMERRWIPYMFNVQDRSTKSNAFHSLPITQSNTVIIHIEF